MQYIMKIISTINCSIDSLHSLTLDGAFHINLKFWSHCRLGSILGKLECWNVLLVAICNLIARCHLMQHTDSLKQGWTGTKKICPGIFGSNFSTSIGRTQHHLPVHHSCSLINNPYLLLPQTTSQPTVPLALLPVHVLQQVLLLQQPLHHVNRYVWYIPVLFQGNQPTEKVKKMNCFIEICRLTL